MEDKNEELEARRRKLKFRAWHRGTREMDLLMGSFADRHVHNFDSMSLDQFEQLLSCNDPDLYNWFSGQETPPIDEYSDVMDLFLRHKVSP